MKYIVYVEEIYERGYEVEASSEEEAERIFSQRMNEEDMVYDKFLEWNILETLQCK